MLSEFPFLYRFTVFLNSGGSNSPWSEFWSEFPHFMGMGVVPAPSINSRIWRGAARESRYTPSKGPVAQLPVQLFKGVSHSKCLIESVAVQGGVAATLPVALQWAT